jgi:hypothetical protein
MNTGRTRRSRQLALLTVLVLAVHVGLLQPPLHTLAPERPASPARFTTRSIAPPASAAAPEPPAPAVTAPRPPAPKRPAARAMPAAPATPATPLEASLTAWPSAVLHYMLTVRSRGLTQEGTARLDWQQDGERYALQLALSGPGLRERVQQSTGALTTAGLVPERFSDRSRGEQATHFDRAGGRVVFSNNQPGAAWVAGMQDRLSVVLQLALLAAAQPARFVPGTQVIVPTATTRDAGEWSFRVAGEEELELPGGSMRALKLERPPRREFDQRVELWLAPGLAYAPVRLRLTNPDGGWVDQRWSSTDRR